MAGHDFQPYVSKVYASPRDVPSELWYQVVDRDDPFMNLRMLEALYKSWRGRKPFWPVIFLDPQGRAVAATCLCGHKVDLAQLGNPVGRRLILAVRKLWAGFMHVRTLVCGVPLSTAHSCLRLHPGANADQVARELGRRMRRMAWRHWYQATLVKDIDSRQLDDAEPLLKHGFIRAATAPMNVVDVRHSNIDEWLSDLRSHYRYRWRKSLAKFETARLRCEHLQGDQILQVYDRRVHKMYVDLVRRQTMRFERLPFAFFKNLVAAAGDHVRLTVIWQDDRVVAFSWALLCGRVYQNLFCGYDAQLNRECDLYFNMALRDVGYAMTLGVDKILLGQTSNTFKARLGARLSDRHFYVRGIAPVTLALKLFGGYLFPQEQPHAQRDLFPHQPAAARRGTSVPSPVMSWSRSGAVDVLAEVK